MFEAGAITSDFATIFWVAIGMLPVGAIGWIIGMFLLWWNVLGPLASRLQGWPFSVGEEVLILAGNRKGTLARVYEIWTERGQVRVDLGEDAKRSVTDVYSAVTVCSTN